MKIGIISDTHFMNPAKVDLPEWVVKAFQNVDMIIHAGDIERPEAIATFEKIAPFYAVRGNCDHSLSFLPKSRSIDIGPGKLTVAHRPVDARSALIYDSVVMVYGHTHLSTIAQEDDLLVINPGSPMLPRGGLKPSVAILDVVGQKLKAEIIEAN